MWCVGFVLYVQFKVRAVTPFLHQMEGEASQSSSASLPQSVINTTAKLTAWIKHV